MAQLLFIFGISTAAYAFFDWNLQINAAFGLIAEFFTKTTVAIVVVIVIGILLLAARDVLYSAASWSSTELTVAVVAWDAWVVINDIVDVEFKLIVAAIEVIADFLHALGLTSIPTFSLSQITKRFEGPILSPDDIIDAVERVVTCERLGGGLETFSFATKLALTDSLCPSLRYLYPTSIGPAVNIFSFLVFDPDPTKPNSCGCDDSRFPCENDGLCLTANSGYIFLEVLAPLLLAAVCIYYLIRPVIETIGAASGLVVASVVSTVVNAYERFF